MRLRFLRRANLFWRLFLTFFTAMLALIIAFTGILALNMRQTRQSSYENEVLNQTRETASYLSLINQLSYISRNSAVQYLLQEKIDFIRKNYQADIWLVSYTSGSVQCLDANLKTSEMEWTGAVSDALQSIWAGNEIRAQGVFSELGSNIVTIGVPWKYEDAVVGAVLLHISVENLKVEYGTVLWQLVPTALIAFALGLVMCSLAAASQSRPIRDINHAMRDFGRGDTKRRIHLECGGELEELGNSFNRMADELAVQEETRRNFVANVSHELRSPLTSMRGYVQALLDGVIPREDFPKYLQIVLDESVRLTDLVRDLLDLSRIESGKFPMSMCNFDICEMLRRTLLNYAQRIDAKNIVVNAAIPDVPIPVFADTNRIGQVVTNIIDNAVKFLPEQGGRLSLGAEIREKQVYVWVEDNGSGISPEDLPHIFERFYKADKAHTAGMGTGLGLAICQKIMEQHGTRIEAASEPGKTIFSFLLPLGNFQNSVT